MTTPGRHRSPPPLARWRTHVSVAAVTVGLFGTGGALASAYAATIDVHTDTIDSPPTATETAAAVRGPRGPLVLPSIGPPNRWDPSKGEVLATTPAWVPPPVVPEPEPTTEPVTTTTPAATTTPAPTTTATPTTTVPTTTTAETTTTPAPTAPTAPTATTSATSATTTTATPTDTPTPTLPTVTEEPGNG